MKNYDIILTSCPNPSHIVEYLHCLEEKETRETRRGISTDQRTNHIQPSVGQFIVDFFYLQEVQGGNPQRRRRQRHDGTEFKLSFFFYS